MHCDADQEKMWGDEVDKEIDEVTYCIEGFIVHGGLLFTLSLWAKFW